MFETVDQGGQQGASRNPKIVAAVRAQRARHPRGRPSVRGTTRCGARAEDLCERAAIVQALECCFRPLERRSLLCSVPAPGRPLGLDDRLPGTGSFPRIRDGNSIAPPRDLIDLVTKAQEAQLRKVQRGASEFKVGERGRGHLSLMRSSGGPRPHCSTERVEDTLLAEAGDHAGLIGALQRRQSRAQRRISGRHAQSRRLTRSRPRSSPL